MIAWVGSLRRFLLIAIALAGSWPVLHGAISSALITRGDGLLYAGDGRAQSKYRLALEIDPGNIVAADRYVFTAFLEHRRGRLEDAIRVANAVLGARPDAASVRMDRALCLQRLGMYGAAEHDFERVGEELGDVQALALAASDSVRSGNVPRARRLLRMAQHIDPRYVPVRVALARLIRELD